MSYVNELKSKHGGLTAHIVKTEKFKTVSLIFKMLAPLTKDQVTKRALLVMTCRSPFFVRSADTDVPYSSSRYERNSAVFGWLFVPRRSTCGSSALLVT